MRHQLAVVRRAYELQRAEAGGVHVALYAPSTRVRSLRFESFCSLGGPVSVADLARFCQPSIRAHQGRAHWARRRRRGLRGGGAIYAAALQRRPRQHSATHPIEPARDPCPHRQAVSTRSHTHGGSRSGTTRMPNALGSNTLPSRSRHRGCRQAPGEATTATCFPPRAAMRRPRSAPPPPARRRRRIERRPESGASGTRVASLGDRSRRRVSPELDLRARGRGRLRADARGGSGGHRQCAMKRA